MSRHSVYQHTAARYLSHVTAENDLEQMMGYSTYVISLHSTETVMAWTMAKPGTHNL